MRSAALVLCAGCITKLPEVADPCATWERPDLYSLKVDGRTAQIQVPGNAGPRTAMIVLHGARASGVDMREVSGLDAAGADAGIVTVFPNGTGRGLGFGRTWDAEGCCPPALGKDEDVGWLDALAVTLEERVCADRIVVAGFSNGGMMALRYGCEGERVDGVIAAAGALFQDTCTDRAVPVLLAHGLADEIVPFEGGVFPGTDHPVPSSDAAVEVLLERNDCLPTSVLDDRGEGVVCERFECPIAVERCTLEGWGHKWPGGRNAPDAGFDLTREALRFVEDEVRAR